MSGRHSCNRCGFYSLTRLYYSKSCSHVLCHFCLNKIVWSQTTHFFCTGGTCGSYCPLCKPDEVTTPCSTWPEIRFNKKKNGENVDKNDLLPLPWPNLKFKFPRGRMLKKMSIEAGF